MPTIQLPDGRVLDIRVSGPAAGVPLVFHHGTPGSLLPFSALEAATHERGLRLVTYSRAGYGSSTRRPGRTVVDVVADVTAVLDYLDARRCLVAGWSGGGPHALATAARLRERVSGVLVLAGVAPHGAEGLDWLDGMGAANVEEFGLARQGEAPLRPFVETGAAALTEVRGDQLAEAMDSLISAADLRALSGPLGDDVAAQLRESARSGGDGWLDDDLAFVRPWGFELDEIALPTFLWQGSEDLMVPTGHGRWLAQHLPGVSAHFESGQGHLSLLADPGPMLDELVTTL